jgi:Zn-dependent M28 family amino/carboxypeptidase
VALLVAAAGTFAAAAERMTASAASIQAGDAGRHVGTLADDAFEGREGGTRGGRAAAAYIVEQLERMDLEPAGDQGGWYQPFGGLRNVLAILPGSDPVLGRELVVVGAHYDHVGYGSAANSYGPFGHVHNGADDNASGVAGLLEIAEAMQRLPSRPRRTILFAFWDGEEKGLLGSSHFLRVRPASVADRRIVCSVNMDMIGRLRGRLEVYGTRTAVGLREAVVQANSRPSTGAGLDLAFVWDIEEDSDHFPFIAAGIPTVMFHTGLHDNYHRPSDDVHLVNLDGIEPVARLALGFVVAAADDPTPFPTFRAACRGESNATRNRLEAAVPDQPDSPSGRWGIGTRDDPGEPGSPVVVRVWRESAAERGGLRVGDRILTVDSARIVSQDDMVGRLRTAGPAVELDVERRGRIMRVALAAAGAGEASAHEKGPREGP